MKALCLCAEKQHDFIKGNCQVEKLDLPKKIIITK